MSAVTPDEARMMRCLKEPLHPLNTCREARCMAWRWVNTSASVPVKIENGATVYEIKETKTHGYCGLAGAVQ